MKELLEQVMEKAKDAGKKVMEYYMKDYTIEQKVNKTPVTEADVASEALLKTELQKIVDCPFLGEEGRDDLSRLEQDTLWIVDPLDGTKDFIAKTGDFSVMIALVRDGSPMLGVVYAPAKHMLYYAASGQGAYRQTGTGTQRLAVEPSHTPPWLVTSRHNLTPLDEYLVENIGTTERIKSGSFGLKTALIAEGQCDFYFTSNGNASEWDTAASEILIREAGGRMTDFYGKPLLYNQREKGRKDGVLVSNSYLHDHMLQKIQELQHAYNSHL